MASKNKRYTREFSYTRPIMYQGEQYPSADSVITDEYGNKSNGQIFADAYGQYYTKDKDNNVFPVMPVENLDEVTISAPRKRGNLSEAFSRFLALGNDNTQVNNLPHREYNTSLKANAERGAREHALWDKEHPNLSAWRDAATAVPFAVAATPFVAGGGSALLNTGLGQAAKHGIAAIMENPYVAGANDAVGLGFAGKGAYDVSQGKFTPETAMDIAGGLGLMAKGSSMFDRMLTVRKPTNKVVNSKNTEPEIIFDNDRMPIGGTSEGIDTSDWEDVDLGDLGDLPKYDPKIDFPLLGETEIPMDLKAKAAKEYTDFINSDDYYNRLKRAGLESHWKYIKKLTDQRVNGKGYFPGRVEKVIDNDPYTTGLSSIDPSSPTYGITLKDRLYVNKLPNTLNHELAHWATKNAGPRSSVKVTNFFPNLRGLNDSNIGDIMEYNENIVPNISWEDKLKSFPKNIPIDKLTQIAERYSYLTDPQEKRARAYSLYQQAKRNKLSLDKFVDAFIENGKIAPYAPQELHDLGSIFTINNLKKYLKNFLSVTIPVGLVETNKDFSHEQ